MSTKITISLSDDTYRRAEHLAGISGRQIDDVLAETLQITLSPLSLDARRNSPVRDLSDSEVIQLADSMMEQQASQRFSELLDKQQSGTMTSDESHILLALLQEYQDGQLRKAEALNEAVKRGLKEPPAP